MIPDLTEFINAVKGAWKLLLWDEDGLKFFDVSVEGFWRSFWAPVAAFPAFVLVLLSRIITHAELNAIRPETADPLPPLPPTEIYLLEASLLYVLGNILFPLVMVPVARTLNLSQHYVPYIVSWLWFNALMVMLLGAPALFLVADLLSAVASLAITLVLFIASLSGQFFIARKALGTNTTLAILLVGLQFLLGLILESGLHLIFS